MDGTEEFEAIKIGEVVEWDIGLVVAIKNFKVVEWDMLIEDCCWAVVMHISIDSDSDDELGLITIIVIREKKMCHIKTSTVCSNEICCHLLNQREMYNAVWNDLHLHYIPHTIDMLQLVLATLILNI